MRQIVLGQTWEYEFDNVHPYNRRPAKNGFEGASFWGRAKDGIHGYLEGRLCEYLQKAGIKNCTVIVTHPDGQKIYTRFDEQKIEESIKDLTVIRKYFSDSFVMGKDDCTIVHHEYNTEKSF